MIHDVFASLWMDLQAHAGLVIIVGGVIVLGLVYVVLHARRRTPHYRILRDIWHGAWQGDFAKDLRIPGVITQILVGYMPIVGTLCAARDYVADRQSNDNFGAFLNFLALLPIAGGFPHTAEIIHRMSLSAELAAKASEQIDRLRAQATRDDTGGHHVAGRVQAKVAITGTAAGKQNELAHLSLVLAILMPFLVLLGGIGLLMPIPVIAMSYVALHRAKHLPKGVAHRVAARMALFLGYLYLVLFAGLAYLVLVVAPFGPLHH